MRLRLRPEHLFPIALLACLFAFVSTHPIRPHDFWWHLAAGKQIVTTGHIPTTDSYSYTAPGAPYPSYQVYWLAEAMLYLAYAAGGVQMNIFAHAVLITATYGLLLLLCFRLSGNWKLATVCGVAAAALGFENWNLRPQALAYLCGVVYLWLIYSERKAGAGETPALRGLGGTAGGPRSAPTGERGGGGARCGSWNVALFPLVIVVWVNCHGSFPIGLVLIGLWLIESVVRYRRDREVPFGSAAVPAVALLSALAAVWFNPQHFGVIQYLRDMQANTVVQGLPEWLPASLATRDGIAFFLVLAASVVMMAWAGKRGRVGVFEALTFVLFAALAWKTGRAIVWFGLVVAPVLAGMLGERRQRGEVVDDRAATACGRMVTAPTGSQVGGADRVMVPVLMGLFVALVIVALPWFKGYLPLPPQKAPLLSLETPVRSTAWLLEHNPPGRLFHHMSYGSYLIWAAPGRYQVFVDPRV
ncbi:MAG: hypothetical protein ABFD94_06145, partial [Armatimonadia bacterium]